MALKTRAKIIRNPKGRISDQKKSVFVRKTFLHAVLLERYFCTYPKRQAEHYGKPHLDQVHFSSMKIWIVVLKC